MDGQSRDARSQGPRSARAAAVFPDDDAYRFRHLLIRDTAYEALPKATRAELHERFADLAARSTAPTLVELDEIVGYHLEQAYRYRAELGPLDDRATALAEQAATRLLAGRRPCAERGDGPAVIRLLRARWRCCRQADPEAPAAQLELARALSSRGDLDACMRAAGRGRLSCARGGRRTARALRIASGSTSSSLVAPRLEDDRRLSREAEAARRARPHRRRRQSRLGAARDRRAGRLARQQRRGRRRHWRRAVERGAASMRQPSSTTCSGGCCWVPGGGRPRSRRVRELADERSRRRRPSGLRGYARVVRGVAVAAEGRLEERAVEVLAGRTLLRDLGDGSHGRGSRRLEADMELAGRQSRPRVSGSLADGAEVLRGKLRGGYLATGHQHQSLAALELGRQTGGARA